jgi:hypothetical protein
MFVVLFVKLILVSRNKCALHCHSVINKLWFCKCLVEIFLHKEASLEIETEWHGHVHVLSEQTLTFKSHK